MNGEFSLWRVEFPEADFDRFVDLLSKFRPEQNKISRIEQGFGGDVNSLDVIVSEEELAFLALSFKLKHTWIQDWIYGKI